jgi:hypothetical protein
VAFPAAMSNARPKKFIAVAVAFALGVALVLEIAIASQSGVRVHSTNKRLTIYEARYFPGSRFDGIFAPFGQRVKLQWRLALQKLGVKFYPVEGFSVHGKGPALVIWGRIEVGESPQLSLVTDSGQHVGSSDPISDSKNKTFLWCDFLDNDRGLTNGLYHVRHSGKTNNLADVRVRM